ncbi:MAG: histidine kinase [Beutenbergiaceae bacterium]
MSQFHRQVNPAMVRRDLVVALSLGVAGMLLGVLAKLAQYFGRVDVPAWQIMTASLVFAVPLIWRRRFPSAAGVAVLALYVLLMELQLLEFNVSQIVLFLAFYSIGAWEQHRRRAFWVRLAGVILMAVWLVVGAIRSFYTPETGEYGVQAYFSMLLIQVAINAGYFGGGWIFGDRSWEQAIERKQLQSAQAEIRAQQAQLTEQAISLERVRIARELHDVVAHHVSAMGIQAGAARRVLSNDPERASVALRAVEDSARTAISELGTMVGALRSTDDNDAPMPTLADLPDLVQDAREYGPITFAVVGEQRQLSPSLELTAYRVVQEALTNVRKHGGAGVKADVRVRYLPDAVEVEVSDDGHATASAVAGLGIGQTGMKERVMAVGGTVQMGPKSRGGYLVRASIPTDSDLGRVDSADLHEAGSGASGADAPDPDGPGADGVGPGTGSPSDVVRLR